MSPAEGRRVAITGVASDRGGELARRLESDRSISYIAGIDTRPPAVHHVEPPEAAHDRRLVFDVSELVRETIQARLYESLVKRGSTFL